jgi:hypothetical protein
MPYVSRTTEEVLVSFDNIFPPYLRRLEFYQLSGELSDDRHEARVAEFHDQLKDFLIFRSTVHWYDVESDHWRQNDGFKVLKCLRLESFLREAGSFQHYVQDLVCVPNQEANAAI